MRTDGVVLGTLTQFDNHTHLEWVCPDCGNSGYTAGENSPCRLVCVKTGREFLVVGISPQRRSIVCTVCVVPLVPQTRPRKDGTHKPP